MNQNDSYEHKWDRLECRFLAEMLIPWIIFFGFCLISILVIGISKACAYSRTPGGSSVEEPVTVNVASDISFCAGKNFKIDLENGGGNGSFYSPTVTGTEAVFTCGESVWGVNLGNARPLPCPNTNSSGVYLFCTTEAVGTISATYSTYKSVSGESWTMTSSTTPPPAPTSTPATTSTLDIESLYKLGTIELLGIAFVLYVGLGYLGFHFSKRVDKYL
jgi:hypothetical protein